MNGRQDHGSRGFPLNGKERHGNLAASNLFVNDSFPLTWHCFYEWLWGQSAAESFSGCTQVP